MQNSKVAPELAGLVGVETPHWLEELHAIRNCCKLNTFEAAVAIGLLSGYLPRHTSSIRWQRLSEGQEVRSRPLTSNEVQWGIKKRSVRSGDFWEFHAVIPGSNVKIVIGASLQERFMVGVEAKTNDLLQTVVLCVNGVGMNTTQDYFFFTFLNDEREDKGGYFDQLLMVATNQGF